MVFVILLFYVVVHVVILVYDVIHAGSFVRLLNDIGLCKLL